MKGDRRPAYIPWLWVGLSAGVLAVVALFRLLHASPTALLVGFARAPWWVYGATVLLTILNQFIGAAKWRRAAQWLTPDAPQLALGRLVEATTVGSFLGQFLPLQVSSPLGRWLLLRGNGARWIVQSSIYEQIFDLVALLAAGIAGLLVILIAPRATSVVSIFVLVVLVCLAGLRIFLRLAARLFRWVAVKRNAEGLAGRMAEVFGRAGNAPVGALLTLFGWSIARLATVALRAVVVAATFVPAVPPVLVAAAYPAAGLATALPIAPAGLGVAEWSWTGMLVFLGAAGPTAAVASLAFRLMNMIALSLISAGVLALRLVRGSGENGQA